MLNIKILAFGQSQPKKIQMNQNSELQEKRVLLSQSIEFSVVISFRLCVLRIRTISRRSRLTTLGVNNCGTLKNPLTIRKEKGTEFPVLWSGLYPSQKHLAWLLCSGLIHGRLAAARGAFHMYSADPVELRPS